VLKQILRRFTDTIIFGNFFIAACAAGLVSETYVLLGYRPIFDGLTFFVFFSTLGLYNFHRLMGVRRIKPEDRGAITGWAAKHQFTLLMLVIIGLGGMGFFFFQLPVKIISVLVVLGTVSVFYELPLVKYNKRFERLRNLWLSKAFLITLVWAFTTALLPAIKANVSLADYSVWLIMIERIMFIFILALCFDARDVIFDRKDSIKTIPIVFGMEMTNRLYAIFSVLFFSLCLVHFLFLQTEWGTAIAMILSSGATYWVVSRTEPRRSDYYYMFLADGMMLLQFLLTLILAPLL